MKETINNFNNLIVKRFDTWIDGFLSVLPNIFLATIVIVALYFIGKASQKPAKATAKRFSENPSIADLFSKLSFLLIFTFGIFTALSILNLDKALTSLLAGAGVIGLALGFAFQEIASNFVSGILISIQKPYRVNDIVEIGSYMGTVHRIDLRVTAIQTFQGLEVLIPNKQMYTSSLINYTTTPERRIDFKMGISYGEDLNRVEKIVRQSLENIEGKSERDIEVYFNEFGDSSINFVILVWIYYPGDNYYWKTHHQIVTNIKKAFNENDITIPFPIRTLDFGIKGGLPLDKALSRSPKEQELS